MNKLPTFARRVFVQRGERPAQDPLELTEQVRPANKKRAMYRAPGLVVRQARDQVVTKSFWEDIVTENAGWRVWGSRMRGQSWRDA